MDHRALGYALLRFVLGINFFMHGAVRVFGDYAGFAQGVVGEFSGSVLPEAMVRLVGWGIPPVELAVGVALILGLFTRTALVAGGLLMGVLVFGMGLLQNWGTVADQMLYTLLFALLLFELEYNRLALDRLFWRGSE